MPSPVIRGSFKALAHWRVFPAVYGSGMTAAAGLLLSAHSIMSVITSFFTLPSIYNLNNMLDRNEDKENSPEKADFVKNNEQHIGLFVIASSVAAVTLTLNSGLLPGLLVISSLVSGIVYGSNATRVKNIFPVNTILVSITLSTISVGLPVTFENEALGLAECALFTYLCVRFAITVEMCNIPDVAGDRHAGVTTLPSLIGVRGSKKAIYLVELVITTILLYLYLKGTISINEMVVLGAPAVHSAAANYLTSRDPPLLGPGVYGDAQLLLAGIMAYSLL